VSTRNSVWSRVLRNREQRAKEYTNGRKNYYRKQRFPLFDAPFVSFGVCVVVGYERPRRQDPTICNESVKSRRRDAVGRLKTESKKKLPPFPPCHLPAFPCSVTRTNRPYKYDLSVQKSEEG